MKSIILFCSLFLFTYHFSFPGYVCAAPPKRIVSLAPSITEILFALGLGDRVVGVTLFCDHPAEAKKKQKVGGMSNPSIEGVVSLRPDIVVMSADGNPRELEEMLRLLKIRTYVFKAQRLSELPGAIAEMGTALEVSDRADSLAGEIEAAINRLKTRRQVMGGSSNKKKVLFIIWPEPLIVAGPGTLIDDAITLLGNRNLASGAKTTYPKYSIEDIVRRSPDVIIIGKGHSDMKEISAALLQKLKSVPAVRNKRVFYAGDGLFRLGPRVVEGIEEISGYLK